MTKQIDLGWCNHHVSNGGVKIQVENLKEGEGHKTGAHLVISSTFMDVQVNRIELPVRAEDLLELETYLREIREGLESGVFTLEPHDSGHVRVHSFRQPPQDLQERLFKSNWDKAMPHQG